MFNDICHQDKIILPELSFWACHGVLPQEHEQKQEFKLRVELILDTEEAAESDDLADTVDYGQVYRQIEKIMLGPRHNLLESLASQIAHTLLADEQVQAVTVRLEKCLAPLAPCLNAPAVLEWTRTVADFGM